ncbi:uncharacterized protein METZ01_LOCUS88450, partial [marine metagenome]
MFKRLPFLFFIFHLLIKAQNDPVNRNNFQIEISPTNEEIIIDGEKKEEIWKSSPIIKDFFRITPVDTGLASAYTEVQLTYDDNNLYVAIICHDKITGKRPVESLRRDFNFPKNDNFIIFMDTYNDQTNGFAFGVSAAGAQWDGIQADGGDVSLDWDCKWYSAVKQHEAYWVAEFAIPFRSIRYLEGVDEWGINFSRFSLLENEKSAWAPVPRQFKSSTLAFTGTLKWENPPPSLGTRFSIIPYLSSQTFENIDAGEKISSNSDFGLDGKITLSTSLNVDLTVNPDFSQVEVDKQRTNLDRFELFFPEKRQFFLENSDLFASLGNKHIRPFFSRRIGFNSPVKIGARFSGKIGSNYRLGIMNVQTEPGDDNLSSVFTVATIQRKMFSRSSLSTFIVNKNLDNIDDNISSYNRIVGLDFNLASADNLWIGKAFYHHSFYKNAGNKPFATTGSLKYNNGVLSADIDYSFVGSGYEAEVGFVKRNGYHQFRPKIEYKFYPNKGSVQNHGPSIKLDTFVDEDF